MNYPNRLAIRFHDGYHPDPDEHYKIVNIQFGGQSSSGAWIPKNANERGRMFLNGACFAGIRGGPKHAGDLVGMTHSNELVSTRYTPSVMEFFPEFKTGRDVVDWWLDEVKLIGQDHETVPGEEVKARCDIDIWHRNEDEPGSALKLRWVFFEKDGNATEDLAKLTLLDFVTRFVDFTWVYLNLRKRLPQEDPWHLFQVVHFLGTIPRQSTSDPKLLGFLSYLPTDSLGAHGFGQSNGAFPLREKYTHAIAALHDGGSLSHGFFLSAVEKRKVDHLQTFDQFAEYTKKYIDKEKELF